MDLLEFFTEECEQAWLSKQQLALVILLFHLFSFPDVLQSCCREELSLFMQPIFLMDWKHGQRMWHTSKMVIWRGQENFQTSLNWKVPTICYQLLSHGFDQSQNSQKRNPSNLSALLPDQVRSLLLIHLLLDHLGIWHTTADYRKLVFSSSMAISLFPSHFFAIWCGFFFFFPFSSEFFPLKESK